RRHLLVGKPYATTTFDKVGVLRHELGHVLGFRHEHIRSEAPAVCQTGEQIGFAYKATNYDPQSVMHYFCGDGSPVDEERKKLKISDLDKKGAQLLYPKQGEVDIPGSVIRDVTP